MTLSPRLAMPSSGTIGSSLAVNEGIFRFDIAVCCHVKNRSQSTPPASPVDGWAYLIVPIATGAWAGREGEIAAWSDDLQAWVFITPWVGFVFFDEQDQNNMYVYTSWTPPTFALKSWPLT